MDACLNKRRSGETDAHRRLKRLAAIWAQVHGYSACAVEVSLPQCRYRADVAAYRPSANDTGVTAIFECKQVISDLRRDNCCRTTAEARLESMKKRRAILEKHLRIHYPTLRSGEALFAEYDAYDFTAIEHRAYGRVLREISALQNRIRGATKFETLTRYRSANLFYLVVPNELFRESEIPVGWGALVERGGTLVLARKPLLHESSAVTRIRFLHRIAQAGTRHLNRQLEIDYDLLTALRREGCVPSSPPVSATAEVAAA